MVSNYGRLNAAPYSRGGTPISDIGPGYTLYDLSASGQLEVSGGGIVTPGVAMVDPELNADDSRVVYIDPSTHQVVVRSIDYTGLGAALVVSADSAADSDPQWSQDGATVTYESGGNVLRVNAPASGATSVTPVAGTPIVTGASGAVPVTLASKFVVREWGSNALNTAVAVSQRNYQAVGEANSATDKRVVAHCVVLSRSDQFYDALTGSAFARSEECPLLLVPHTGMTSDVMAEIQRVLAIGNTVYVLGGYAALPQSVDEALDTAGYPVVRFAGSNMYDTAVKIDQQMAGSQPFIVMVATGSSYYDALAAAPQVANFHSALVLSTGGVSNASLSSASLNYLNSIKPLSPSAGGAELLAVGGPAQAAVQKALAAGQLPAWSAAPSYAVESLVGANAEETALDLAYNFQYGPPRGVGHVGVATVKDWHDALAGGATVNALLLTPPDQLYPGDAAFLSSDSPFVHEVDVFGGTAALSAAIPSGIVPLIGSTQAVQNLEVTPGNVPPILLTQGVLNNAAQPNLARSRANLQRK
jgi:hypothetical protein